MTDEENVIAAYPSAFLYVGEDSINIYGRLMYDIKVFVYPRDSKPVLCRMVTSTTKAGAWNCAWREVQREMLKKLES
jgi:hypothetical protein